MCYRRISSGGRYSLDFRMPHTIGECIDADHPQLKVVNGYDHTWELNTKGDDTRPAAWVYDPASGRKMEIFTTEPGNTNLYR